MNNKAIDRWKCYMQISNIKYVQCTCMQKPETQECLLGIQICPYTYTQGGRWGQWDVYYTSPQSFRLISGTFIEFDWLAH